MTRPTHKIADDSASSAQSEFQRFQDLTRRMLKTPAPTKPKQAKAKKR